MDIGQYRIIYDSDLKEYVTMLITNEKIDDKPMYKMVSQHPPIDEAVKGIIDKLVSDTIESPLNKEMEKVKQAKEALDVVRKELGIDEESMS